MATSIIIMLRNTQTGFFEKELGTCQVWEGEEFLAGAYAEADGEKLMLHLLLTAGRNVADWEFGALLDYYDEGAFQEVAVTVIAREDHYNPTWEIVLPWEEDLSAVEEAVGKIISLHRQELADTWEAIQDKQEAYEEENE